MIVTYSLSLRGSCGESTIIVAPPLGTLSEQDLLTYIQTSCLIHYNSKQVFTKDHLTDPSKILILFMKEFLF